MDRLDWYFRQLVTEGNLDAAFDNAETADKRIVSELALDGVVTGLVVSQHAPVPDFTVDVTPGTTYDPEGRRVRVPTTQNPDCVEDEAGVPTAVQNPGNEKWVSVFAEFDRALSDPRTDGNGQTVYFARAESFRLNVTQGAEAAIGNAVRPQLRDDQTLLCDVRLEFGDASIVDARIDTTRRQDAVVVDGTPNSVRAGSLREAVGDVVAALNTHVTNADAGHPATSIDVEARNAWYDGTTNPATDLQTALGKVVDDLTAAGVGASGAHRVGIAARANWADGGGHPAGDVFNAVNQVVGDLAATTNPSGADHVGTRARSNWYGGTTNPAGTLYAAIEKVIADLAATGATAGADLVGAKARASWYGGTTNPITSVQGALAKIVDDLKATTGSDCIGSAAWSAETPVQLSSGSVMSQLAWLAHEINSHLNDSVDAHDASAISSLMQGGVASTNVQGALEAVATGKANLSGASFTGTVAVNPSGGIDEPIIRSDQTVGGSKALLARLYIATVSGVSVYLRLYYSSGGVFEITYNARWDIANNEWAKDQSSQTSGRTWFSPTSGFHFDTRAAVVGTWVSWDETMSIDGDGDMLAAGDITVYGAYEGPAPSGGEEVGCGISFRKRFPATASSISITPVAGAAANIVAGSYVSAYAATTGIMIRAQPTDPSSWTRFAVTVVVA